MWLIPPISWHKKSQFFANYLNGWRIIVNMNRLSFPYAHFMLDSRKSPSGVKHVRSQNIIQSLSPSSCSRLSAGKMQDGWGSLLLCVAWGYSLDNFDILTLVHRLNGYPDRQCFSILFWQLRFGRSGVPVIEGDRSWQVQEWLACIIVVIPRV